MQSDAVNPEPAAVKPRPALTLVQGPQAISYDKYECFAGVSGNVSDLKAFIAVQATQIHPALLIGERGLRQEQVARALHRDAHAKTVCVTNETGDQRARRYLDMCCAEGLVARRRAKLGRRAGGRRSARLARERLESRFDLG